MEYFYLSCVKVIEGEGWQLIRPVVKVARSRHDLHSQTKAAPLPRVIDLATGEPVGADSPREVHANALAAKRLAGARHIPACLPAPQEQ